MPGDDKLVLEIGGARREFTLPEGSVTIGRAATSDIRLTDPRTSRSHARIDVTPAGREIVDLGSANGLFVNGVRVSRALLKPADLVGIGDAQLHFSTGAADPDATQVVAHVDPDATVVGGTLPVHLEDTSVPRVAVTSERGTFEVRLTRDSTTVGRHPGSDILLDWPAVSRRHAVLERHGADVVVRDLGSRNGVRLRGEPVTHATLHDGESVEIGPARLVFKRAFGGSDLTLAGVPRRAVSKRPPVVVIPGFGGSMLWRGSEQIWPAPRMILSHPELLDIDEPLEARGLVDEVVIIPNLIKQDQYSALTTYLKEDLAYEAGRDLVEFAYDFRQDNRVSARALGAAIEEWNPLEPITIVAHSMGCLVARYYVECLGGGRLVNRVIYLGAPHGGTPYAFASLLHGPDLLPLGLLNARLRDVLATYPSWYQILPTYQFVADQRAPFEVLLDHTWLADTHRPLVKNAHSFRAELGTHATVRSVCVFGYGLKTITSATVQRESGSPCRSANFVVEPKGDGMIPEISGVLQGAEIHPVKQHHGSLYADSDVKMRLKLELTRPLGS